MLHHSIPHFPHSKNEKDYRTKSGGGLNDYTDVDESDIVGKYCMEPFCMEMATDFGEHSDLIDDEEYKIWLRGNNKWVDIPEAGHIDGGEPQLTSDAIKISLKLGENLDRILYKSSGAAALQTCVWKAWEAFHPQIEEDI